MQGTTRTRSRAVQRIAALGVATLASFGLVLGAASPALAHDELLDTTLEFDSTTQELSAITLTFSNNIMEVGTEIVVTDEAGGTVSTAAPEVSGPSVKQPLDAPLTAGSYQTVWRVVSSDGHPIQGVSAFEVNADGSAALTEVAEEAAHEEEHEHSAEEAEAEHDHADAVTTQANDTQDGSDSFPVAGWIAIAVALVLVIGGGAFAVARKRKQTAVTSEAAAATDVSESSN